MNDLVQFLRDRLDEDDQAARAAHQPNWLTDGRRGLRYGMDDSWMTDALTTADADHIARHDPARVLREVEAKRQLLDEHDTRAWKIGDRVHDCQWREWPCQTLRLLALSYADHPEYRADWRP